MAASHTGNETDNRHYLGVKNFSSWFCLLLFHMEPGSLFPSGLKHLPGWNAAARKGINLLQFALTSMTVVFNCGQSLIINYVRCALPTSPKLKDLGSKETEKRVTDRRDRCISIHCCSAQQPWSIIGCVCLKVYLESMAGEVICFN
jgi:hypothetical protein